MKKSAHQLDPAMVPLLLEWYSRSARDLPWRKDKNPYRVWLSEIMCQQTRISAVIDYFNRFAEVLPTVEALAAADEELLQSLWAGLGYYRRMRLLQKCARTIVEQYNGVFPSTAEELEKLPGIGRYTAGAIASIAFDTPSPAVDGNVLRVLSRLSADNGWDQENASEALKKIYPAQQCGEFTQSLMELGAIVCVPNGAPHCLLCPLHQLCKAGQQGNAEQYPAKAPKAVRPVEQLHVFLLFHGGCIAVRKRPDKGLLAGLWELPNEPAETARIPEFFGQVLAVKQAKHIFTHREWRMTVFYIAATERFPEFQWLPPEECPLPSAFRKLLTC